MESDANANDSERLATMLQGYIVTQLIASAVRLNIPDHLADRSLTDAQLGEFTGINGHIIGRYLRALAAVGLVEAHGQDRYRGTALAEMLRRDTGRLYGHALISGGDYYDAWSDLDYALRTGKSAFEHRHGRTLWEQFAANDEVAASFARTMRWNTERVMTELLSLYEFPSAGVVADLGAGDGTLLAGILRRHPDLRGIALEQAVMVDQTRQALDEHGLSDRCEVLVGDIRVAIPEGADFYLLKAVLHNWDDPMAVRILRNCRAAMGEQARLLVIERVASDDDPFRTAMADLSMLVLFGSRDRTAAEYRALVEQAGFAVCQTSSAESGLSVLVAAPATQ